MKSSVLSGRLSFYCVVLIFVFLTAFLLPINEISAAPIPELFNTGVDTSGNVLPDGSRDENYDLTAPEPIEPAGAFKLPVGELDDLWIEAPEGSAWIGPSNGTDEAPGGVYSYVLRFDLTGLIAETAVIIGDWASDNGSEIFLNGVSTGLSRPNDGFLGLERFKIETGFVSEINELKFQVTNTGDIPTATGLLVSNLSGTAAVPIPAAAWLLGSALIALGGIKRRLGG
jgi:hypothetical protein